MGILQQWRDKAYDEKANKGDLQRFWSDYFAKETDIYAELLKNPDDVVTGTVSELAEKYNIDLMTRRSLSRKRSRRQGKRTLLSISDLTRKSSIRTWWLQARTGSMALRSGTLFSTRRRERRFTRSRRRAEL